MLLNQRIGSVEVQDQLAVLTYLRDAFKFVDRTKICTVGKGYGGYVVAMMLLQDINRVINCSVSISPITNWLNYSEYVIWRNFCIINPALLRFLLHGTVPRVPVRELIRLRQGGFNETCRQFKRSELSAGLRFRGHHGQVATFHDVFESFNRTRCFIPTIGKKSWQF